MLRTACIAATVLCAAMTLGCASMDRGSSAPAGAVIKVASYDQLKKALEEDAEPGDVVEVQPGVYYATSPRINVARSGAPDKPIIVRGVVEDGRRPVIDASRVNTNRGILSFPAGTHDVIIENIELCHALGKRHEYNMNVAAAVTEAKESATPGVGQGGTSESGLPTYGTNAGAVFFDGANITARNCYVHHCEDGFFSTGASDYILVEDCEIAHNGTLWPEPHNATHNFYFNSRHQTVKNCYLHDPRDGQNFQSRGQNTIFAFNWLDEDYAQSLTQSSNGSLNTLWLGNVVAKRTTEGLWQGRLLTIGDGSGTVRGTVVAVNNTFVTFLPRDHFMFSFPTGTADFVLVNNVFAGPGETFGYHNGQGKISGFNNWFRKGLAAVPEGLQDTIYGDDPGFEDHATSQFRLKAGSPLIDAGAPSAEYEKALAIVLANAASGTDAKPSPEYLKALEDVKGSLPRLEPIRKGHGVRARQARGPVDIGAFEYSGR